MLARIKIVERPLKIENTAPIPAEHRDECGIPHEKIAVEGGIDEIRHKPAVCVGLAQISERDFPCGLIAFDRVVMSLPSGKRKPVSDILINGQRLFFDLPSYEGVVCDTWIFDIW